MSKFEIGCTKNYKINQILSDNIMINQIKTTDVDENLIEVYLRLKETKKIYGLINSSKEVLQENGSIFYRGTVDSINYEVAFYAVNNKIFIEVDIRNISEKYDLIHTMDVGLGEVDYLQSNEAYASQYLNCEVIEDKNGINLCMRKSIAQKGKNPFLQLGSLQSIEKYSTDGYQFFKTQYKETQNINYLIDQDLANEVYQYEFSFVAMQTPILESGSKQVFYLKYLDDSQKYAKEEFTLEDIYSDYKSPQEVSNFILRNKVEQIKSIKTLDFTMREIDDLYSSKTLVETTKDGDVLSFFTTNHSHVVLKEKEINMERNHGNIISDINNMDILQNSLSSTNYMMGIFAAQNTVGNTTFNQLLTPSRNSLNVEKTSGLRIYVQKSNEKFMLGMPSIYEIGFNYSKWLYKLEDDIIEVISYIQNDNPKQKISINSKENKDYTYYVSMNFEDFLEVNKVDEGIILTPKEDTYTKSKCPNLFYNIFIDAKIEKDQNIENFYTFELNKNKFEIIGNLYGNFEEIVANKILTYKEENDKVFAKYKKFLNDFHISYKDDQKISKFNNLIYWYLHNGLVHFASPRGLEQYKGAAWGTRDVSQGPLELFLSLQKHDKVRKIIKLIYKSQFYEDGNWSQWFMFDQYQEVAAHESHGDVIVWPLKALCDYVITTGDISILDEEVSFKKRDDNFKFTDKKYKIYEHIKKQMLYIENSLIKGTNLPCYGDGDWDDTLQPKTSEGRKSMVSGWTAALLYETLVKFSKILDNYDNDYKNYVIDFSNKLAEDYKKYIIKDNVAAGFIKFNNDKVEYLLHPEDTTTNIKYRLLPINRGIISELFEKNQIDKSLNIIDENLRCEDGIRLMNKPANYKEGFNFLFQRAEQASTVGREVGLQYVHAHIRYIQAMAHIGKKEEVLQGLNKINPIDLDLFVRNAKYKQRNSYFSSSEGDFKTRYEYADNFEKLKIGEVAIKTGWRIYSSGPGIYINQLISNFLGIRIENEYINFDPCIESKYDGLEFEYRLFECPIKIIYKTNLEKNILVNNETIDTLYNENKYKEKNIKVEINKLKQKLKVNEINIIKVQI